MIVGSLPPRPLILVGDGWQRVWTEFYAQLERLLAARTNASSCIRRYGPEAADMLGPESSWRR